MEKQKKSRQPYKWGAKEFLTGMGILETRVIPASLNFRSLIYMANALKKDVGMQFAQTSRGGVHYITRLPDIVEENRNDDKV